MEGYRSVKRDWNGEGERRGRAAVCIPAHRVDGAGLAAHPRLVSGDHRGMGIGPVAARALREEHPPAPRGARDRPGFTEAFYADPVRRYMIPVFSDRRTDWPSHPYASRDSLHEAEMWAVEGLTHR